MCVPWESNPQPFALLKLTSLLAILLQVEKAKNHYNAKKQLLVESQELNKTLEHSLETSKKEVKALETELTLARMEVDQASTKEKKLAAKLKGLEAQVSLLLIFKECGHETESSFAFLSFLIVCMS